KRMFPGETREPITPQEMWEFYKKKRAEHDVAVIPIYAENFAALVKAPEANDLAELYRKRRDKPYDPSQEENGLQSPQKVAAQFVMGDPESKHYKGAAQALTMLAWSSAGSLLPWQAPGGSLLPWQVPSEGMGSLAFAWDKHLEDVYRDYRKSELHQRKYQSVSLLEKNYPWALFA